MDHVGGGNCAHTLVLESIFLNPPIMNSGFAIATATAFTLGTFLSNAAADWPQFLGPTRDGVYTGQALADQWLPDGPRRLWSHDVGTGWSGPVGKAGRVILFHRIGDQEIVECLRAETGEILWKNSFTTRYVDGFGFDNGPRATPAIAEGRVFLLGANGNFHCLDFQSGKTVWSQDLARTLDAPTGYFGLACSPLVIGKNVLLNIGAPDGAGIVALEIESGKLAWKTSSDEASYSSPIGTTLANRPQAVFFTRHNLCGIDTRSGKEIWKQAWSPAMQASVSAAVPLVSGDLVFATASYGAGALALKVDAKGIHKLWEGDTSLSCQYQTPLLSGGHLYGFHGRLDTGPRPAFRCVELATGRVRWSSEKVDAGSLIRTGKDSLLLTVNGELIRLALSPAEFQESARAQILGLEVRAHPALVDGLYLARDKRRLVCVDLR